MYVLLFSCQMFVSELELVCLGRTTKYHYAEVRKQQTGEEAGCEVARTRTKLSSVCSRLRPSAATRFPVHSDVLRK